tara:strand:- start:1421 stop:1720 length:300 start_codon:yes stop_codon:yes gene_type:complete
VRQSDGLPSGLIVNVVSVMLGDENRAEASGKRQLIRAVKVPLTALPLASLAGLKRARSIAFAQAVSSNMAAPLLDVVVQFVGMPSRSMSNRKLVAPSIS